MLRQAGINRREVVQSRVLTVVEVMALESFLIAGVGNKYDLYAAGVFLFLLYARARVSDIRFINSFTIDVTGSYGYLEAKLQTTNLDVLPVHLDFTFACRSNKWPLCWKLGQSFRQGRICSGFQF